MLVLALMAERAVEVKKTSSSSSEKVGLGKLHFFHI
jgi:hypothetical protein